MWFEWSLRHYLIVLELDLLSLSYVSILIVVLISIWRSSFEFTTDPKFAFFFDWTIYLCRVGYVVTCVCTCILERTRWKDLIISKYNFLLTELHSFIWIVLGIVGGSLEFTTDFQLSLVFHQFSFCPLWIYISIQVGGIAFEFAFRYHFILFIGNLLNFASALCIIFVWICVWRFVCKFILRKDVVFIYEIVSCHLWCTPSVFYIVFSVGRIVVCLLFLEGKDVVLDYGGYGVRWYGDGCRGWGLSMLLEINNRNRSFIIAT